MISQIRSSLSYFVWLILVLPHNPRQVLCIIPDIIPDIVPRATLVTQLDRLPLPPNTLGPVNTDFDSSGIGPYTGVSNGRILKWSGPSTGFVDFAVTSQNWSRQVCESKDMNLEPVCGRPIGIGFNKKKGTLYISDAYKNFRYVESNGGAATLIASSAEGVPFTLTSGLNVDQENGVVYFTDASARFQLKDLIQAILSGDMSGRLMKYDPSTKQVTVLLRNLSLPADAAISKDGTFLLVSEFSKFRILRYWLKGPKANTSEIFFTLPTAFPAAIKMNANGDFWVAFSIGTIQSAIPMGVLLDKNGQVLRILNFATANVTVLVTNVQEYNGKLYIGSFALDYVGVTRTTRG